MGALHLQPAFGRVCAGGEDVQDHAGAIEHLALEGALDVSLLSWEQLGVNHQYVRCDGATRVNRFLQLALTDQRGGIGFANPDASAPGDCGARGVHQPLQLIERGLGRPFTERRQSFNTHEEGPLARLSRGALRS